jgi:hypothetical protein
MEIVKLVYRNTFSNGFKILVTMTIPYYDHQRDRDTLVLDKEIEEVHLWIHNNVIRKRRELIERKDEYVKPKKSIDKVTTNNLQAALLICGINLPFDTIDDIIDLVELLEEKGDGATIGDVLELQESWSKHIWAEMTK